MSRTGVALSLTALVGGLVAVLHGCSHQDCCGSCPGDAPAVFRLSCSSTDLTGVLATGPCARPGASVASYMGNDEVLVPSQGPGVCHVALTFATGFAYVTDVTFTSQPGGTCGGPQCRCLDPVAPASGPFTVDNPPDTCVAAPEAGVDAAAPCTGGCLCLPADSCPTSCYRSQIADSDGGETAPFCSNEVVRCAPGGGAWSVGEPTSNCLGVITYLDRGPVGAYCCGDNAGDAGAE